MEDIITYGCYVSVLYKSGVEEEYFIENSYDYADDFIEDIGKIKTLVAKAYSTGAGSCFTLNAEDGQNVSINVLETTRIGFLIEQE